MVESLTANVLLFAVAAAVIGVGGVLLTRRAEEIAKITGLGDLLTGAILIGAVTSLSGSIMSVAATVQGDASLAVSNAVGGIAVQTTFLAIADMTYRRANLEHDAASEPNLLQGAVLIGLLALPLMAMALPGLGSFGLHPVSVLIVLGYLLGLRLTRGAQEAPMWQPRLTTDSPPERVEDDAPPLGVLQTWVSFLTLAGLVAGCGWVLARVAPVLSTQVGMDQSLMGGIFT
ncbi:MAG: sodium:calcium antiporter, partial [Actinomycetota bacterium]|nr:sodium:calcium antiporter [Actinomycetota bacterium]